MNFEQLKIFMTVVECKSFTKAADALYISHSTTSRNVSALEEDLGVMLLLRNNKTVRLTSAGEILYREGQKLLKKVEAVENAVRNAGMGMSGKLSVASAGQYTSDLWIGVGEFCKKYPEISVALYQRTAEEVFQQVESGEADVGISFSYAAPTDVSELIVESVAAERFCFVVAADHVLAQKKSVSPGEIQTLNYFALPTGENENSWNVPESISAIIPSAVTHVPTIESLFLQIRSGNVVSILPRPLVGDFGAGCAMVDVDGVESSFDVVMLWRKDNFNPCIPLMADILLAARKQTGGAVLC